MVLDGLKTMASAFWLTLGLLGIGYFLQHPSGGVLGFIADLCALYIFVAFFSAGITIAANAARKESDKR